MVEHSPQILASVEKATTTTMVERTAAETKSIPGNIYQRHYPTDVSRTVSLATWKDHVLWPAYLLPKELFNFFYVERFKICFMNN